METQKSWKHYIESARRHMKRIIHGRNLGLSSEKIIFLIIESQKPKKKNAASSGLQKKIFDHPGEIIGKHIKFKGRMPCHLCEEFDGYDMCFGINHKGECPQKLYEMTVKSVSYQWDEHGLTYIVNKGDAEFKQEELKNVKIDG